MGGSNFWDFLPIKVPKRYKGEIHVIRWETLWSNRDLISWIWFVFLLNTRFGSYEYSHSKNNQPQRNLHHNQIQQGNAKKVYLAKEESSLAIFGTDLGHIFGGNVRNDFEKLIRGKRPHEPTFPYDFVRIHSHMIYNDIVEYNILGDTKRPLLRWFPFISKLKPGDTITIGKYMNHQTFGNLQFKRLLKNSFRSIHIGFRYTSGEKILFNSVAITWLVLMFRKVSDLLL